MAPSISSLFFQFSNAVHYNKGYYLQNTTQMSFTLYKNKEIISIKAMKEVYLQNTLSVCLVAANSELSPIVTSAVFSYLFSRAGRSEYPSPVIATLCMCTAEQQQQQKQSHT